MHAVLAQTDSTGLQESLTVISTALSVGLLLFALSKARQRVPLRPVFDAVRLAVQVGGVMLMASFSGVQTPLGAAAGAAMVGAAIGFLQGRELEVEFEDGRVWFRRSVLGVLIWGSGLVIMQVAGLANRAGVVRIGQVVAWFSIGVTVGVIAGRQDGINRTRAAAAASASALAVATLGFSVALQATEEAQAQSDEEILEFGADLIAQCRAGGNTSPTFGTDCEAAYLVFYQGAEEFAYEYCFDSEFAAGGCQDYYDAVLMMGQADLSMLTCESPYSQVPSCVDDSPPPPPDPDPEPEPQPGPEPEPDPEPAPPPPPPPSSTIIVTEDIDPNAAPPVAEIPDEGASLSRPPVEPSGDGGATTDEGSASSGGSSSGSSGGSTSSGGSNGSDSGSGGLSEGSSDTGDGGEGESEASTSPPDDAGSGETALSPLPPQLEDDDEDTVTSDEALEQAVAGLLAAALIGLISWAEAFAAIDALRGSASGTAANQYGQLQQQFPDTGPAPTPGSSAPPSGGPSTPVDSYLPGSTTTAPGGGDPGGGPGAGEPAWVPQGGPGGSSGATGPGGSGAGTTGGGTGTGGGGTPEPSWVPDGFEDGAGTGDGSGSGSMGGGSTGGGTGEPSWVPGGSGGSTTPGPEDGLDHGPGGTAPFGDDDPRVGSGDGGTESTGGTADGGETGGSDANVPDWLLDHGEPAPFDGSETGSTTGDTSSAEDGQETDSGAQPDDTSAPSERAESHAGADPDGDSGPDAGAEEPGDSPDADGGDEGPGLTDLSDLVGESGDEGEALATDDGQTGEAPDFADDGTGGSTSPPPEPNDGETAGDASGGSALHEDEQRAQEPGESGDGEAAPGDSAEGEVPTDESSAAPEDSSEQPAGSDDDAEAGGGIEDWVLGQLEEEQLDPNGAPPRETAGPMGAANSRLTDRDGDGLWDHIEYDDDKDGIYDRTERLEQPINPDGSTTVAPDGEGDAGAPDSADEPSASGPDSPPDAPDDSSPDESRQSTSGESSSDADQGTPEEGHGNPEGASDSGAGPVDDEPVDENSADEVPDDPTPLTRQQIDDMWRWGLANGRSVDDIREDIAGLSRAQGVDGPVEDPYDIRPRPTASGDAPLTPGEAAHYAELQQQLGTLDAQRAELDAHWQELLDNRRRWTSRELNVDLRRMARALEVFELNGTFDDRIATEQEWIRTLKMWRAGDTWADGPDGSSFYDHSFSDRRSFDRAIAERTARITEIDQERIAAMEQARDSRVTTERLDDLDRLQDDLLARRRAVDAEADRIRAALNRYEGFGTSRPLPER